jgi:phospholipid transport system substrate-binding protein
LPNFDFCKMSRLVLGKKGKKTWKRASKAQQDRFVNAFRDLLVRTYSAALVEAAGRVRYIHYSSRKRGSKKAIVKTKVYQRGGSPIKVDYAMYRPGKKSRRKCNLSKGWKVYNVKVGGSSLVTTYRNEFVNYIRIGGINYLIEKVEEKK